MSTLDVAEGRVVLFHYTLKNGAGTVIDSSDGHGPMPYLHGFGNIVPGLERQMTGKNAGDKFLAVVPPDEGYGERTGEGKETVPREMFPADAELLPGMQIQAQLGDGTVIPLWIASVTDAEVTVDQEHPLAGETLHFDVEVVAVRAATGEEMAHGHPHGPDGHGHH